MDAETGTLQERRHSMKCKTSHNKDIDLLHGLTKKPYKVCRKQLKMYKWNLTETWIQWIMRKKGDAE